mmetsp:Transcript_8931/g.11246  ORF Transcript_8931/g.11246 Transcript_8931/m.11246 type:complete len:218 (-) Transcript_8931:1135-1788(-)
MNSFLLCVILAVLGVTLRPPCMNWATGVVALNPGFKAGAECIEKRPFGPLRGGLTIFLPFSLISLWSVCDRLFSTLSFMCLFKLGAIFIKNSCWYDPISGPTSLTSTNPQACSRLMKLFILSEIVASTITFSDTFAVTHSSGKYFGMTVSHISSQRSTLHDFPWLSHSNTLPECSLSVRTSCKTLGNCVSSPALALSSSSSSTSIVSRFTSVLFGLM